MHILQYLALNSSKRGGRFAESGRRFADLSRKVEYAHHMADVCKKIWKIVL